MTIECYYEKCPYHSCHENSDESPFCYEEECKAFSHDLVKYERIRQKKSKDMKVQQDARREID